MDKKKVLTIDRATWLFGGDTYSFLLRSEDKKMCCLGFFAESCGISRKALSGNCGLEELGPINKKKLFNHDLFLESSYNIYSDTQFACNLMSVNDDAKITNKDREKQITELFAQANVKVKFKGKYPKEGK